MLNPQLWLSLDLSLPVGSFSIHQVQGKNEVCLRAVTLEEKNKHSEKFLPSLLLTLKELNLTLKDFDRFITSSGPGSYTGLRIAYATLKAFSMATNKPIETVETKTNSRELVHTLLNSPNRKEIFLAADLIQLEPKY